MNFWFFSRLAVVVLFFSLGITTHQAATVAEVPPLVAVFVMGALGILFVIGIQRINPFSASRWQRPNWRMNPFNFRQPLHFFHLAAIATMVSFLGSAVRMIVFRESFHVQSYVPLVLGAGVYCGVYLCTLVYRSKMNSMQ